MKPNFIVAGGRRCGSTFLYHILNSHDSIEMRNQTDSTFFIDDSIAKTKKWFDGKINFDDWDKSFLDYKNRFDFKSNDKIYGEKCADILHWVPSHNRVKTIIPDVKIILQLRHPVLRAFSQYRNEIYKGREWLSFEEAIEQEEYRSSRSDYAKYHLSYIRGSMYSKALKSIFNYFDREQIKILIFEESVKNNNLISKELFSFLNVNDNNNVDFNKISKNKSLIKLKRRSLFNHRMFDSVIGINDRAFKKLSKIIINEKNISDLSKKEKFF